MTLHFILIIQKFCFPNMSCIHRELMFVHNMRQVYNLELYIEHHVVTEVSILSPGN